MICSTKKIVVAMRATAMVSLIMASGEITALAEYPTERPARKTLSPAEGQYAIHPDKMQMMIKGLGFEIQSDSINSGNQGMPEAKTSVPHDLTPEERQRFFKEMLKGFRYCRLAGGLYWRGLDKDQKYMQGRWPEQMAELKEMIAVSGVEGVSLEYWSPAPFWKANGKYSGKDGSDNVLRCFGKNFANDPVYKGNTNRFLKDFAEACRHDVQYLRDNGIPIAMWGMQNEPPCDTPYSSCKYSSAADYCRAFVPAVSAIRAFDPKIMIISDSWNLTFAAPMLKDPEKSKLIDAMVIHHIGSDANVVRPTLAKIRKDFSDNGKPIFENEYEYLGKLASPARCLNTVLHIMNWLQPGEAPAWFWIHALKPFKNAEASGYSLGFWRPADDADNSKYPAGLKPGHWVWNIYNWHAVGSFVRHLPWDCRSVAVTETKYDDDLRIFAFKRPDGKLTIALANRSFADHVFKVDTGLGDGAVFKGWRYTPEEAGANFMGAEIGTLKGKTISPKVADMTWEFWEEQ
ncbi:MAG: hypothetical protein NTX50_07465 [Candidatus Sumerlaeota bacterium]|nr:hypothetical protein [Candidatus Sumerlaeota bacterium]